MDTDDVIYKIFNKPVLVSVPPEFGIQIPTSPPDNRWGVVGWGQGGGEVGGNRGRGRRGGGNHLVCFHGNRGFVGDVVVVHR